MIRIASMILALVTAQDPVPPPQTPGPQPEARVDKSLRYLLGEQRADGSWLADPSYGEKPVDARSLVPSWASYFCDDTLAATALCARALLAWPASPRTTRSVQRALGFLLATIDQNDQRFRTPRCSPIWQAYALDLLLCLHDASDWAARRPELAAAVRRILDYVAAGECEGGGWTYAYYDSTRGTPRSFTTALVLRSLLAAKAAGFGIAAGPLERGLARLDQARLEGGGYRYLFERPDWPPRATAMGSIGRMALIEGVRLRAGRAGPGDLSQAIETFFRHRSLLDRAVAKQTEYGNEGCHVYFAYCHLVEAMALLPAADRPDRAKQTAEILWARRGPDGTWWDSQRAGPRVATAFALLGLARLQVLATPPSGRRP